MRTTSKLLVGGTALVLAAALGGCSSAAEPTSSGPVTIEFWGWNQGQDAMIDAFNAAHDDVQIKYVQQAGNPETATALQNAAKAGGEAACIAQSPGQIATQLVDGLIQPIGEQISPSEDKFSAGAYSAATIGNDVYAVPFGGNPTFMVVNKTAYDAAGVAIPTTWQGLVDAGEQLKPQGIQVFNLAGEDPSTLTNMAWQAGAQWFSIDGDSWKVDMTSPESLKAADIIQQLIDKDLVSNESYAEWDALMQKFDSGTMVSIPTSTWQMAAYAQNFKNSLGDWLAIDLPSFDGTLATPGGYNFYIVPVGCKHVAQAVEAAVWLATDPTSVALAADTTKGSGTFPTVADPSPYIDGLMDNTMLGDNAGGAKDVVLRADAATVTGWQFAPNQSAVDAELADQWGKVVSKQLTVVQLLENVQAFAISDMKSRGISVSE